MIRNVKADDVRAALSPLLGDRFLRYTLLCAHAADVMNRFDVRSSPIDALLPLLKECIFSDVYNALGVEMTLTLESGMLLKLRLSDVDLLAEIALGVRLDAMDGPNLPLEQLRDYAMRTGSLSAMRVILQRHGGEIDSREREMWVRVICENYPAECYRHWLN